MCCVRLLLVCCLLIVVVVVWLADSGIVCSVRLLVGVSCCVVVGCVIDV